MKHINAQTTFIIEDNLFLLVKEQEIFNQIYKIRKYDIRLKIKKVKGQTVPLYFYVLLKDKQNSSEFKINIKINENILEKMSYYLDYVENIVFIDETTGKMTREYKINKFLKKKWNESIKALQEVYMLKKMLRNIR